MVTAQGVCMRNQNAKYLIASNLMWYDVHCVHSSILFRLIR